MPVQVLRALNAAVERRIESENHKREDGQIADRLAKESGVCRCHYCRLVTHK